MTTSDPPPAPGSAAQQFARYLAAKKTVDDRALNRRVWQSLVNAIADAPPSSPLEILEIGAGIGTMIERLVEWGLLAPKGERPGAVHAARLTAIDEADEIVALARDRLRDWAARRGFAVAEPAVGTLHLVQLGQRLEIDLVAADLATFAAREPGQWAANLIIANAFLDLVDVSTALPMILSLARSGTLLYFTINFDGGTFLEPTIDRPFDDLIERLYHETMDERIVGGQRSGDSRTGRHLFHRLRAVGASVLDIGSSDWVVFPGPSGYPADEAFFLHFIIDTIAGALRGHPALDEARFTAWIAERHAQIERRELVYIAHQLDVLARAGGG